MTDPTQAKQVRIGTGGYKTARRYSWPPAPPHEFTVTSVTSAIKGGLPTPHLIGWAAKMAAECAVADFEIVKLMLEKDDKRAAINHIKGSRYRSMNDKADRGTIVHAAIDAYVKGKPMSKAQMEELLAEKHVPKAMWASTAGMIAGAMEFLWDTEIDILWGEHTLYNRTHKFAGTADIIGRCLVDGAINPAVVDFKTSKSIYDEVALQLCAYSRCEFVGMEDGTEEPILDVPIRHGIVVRPKADGTYERADFRLSDAVFAMFLACLAVTEASDNEVLAEARITPARRR